MPKHNRILNSFNMFIKMSFSLLPREISLIASDLAHTVHIARLSCHLNFNHNCLRFNVIPKSFRYVFNPSIGNL